MKTAMLTAMMAQVATGFAFGFGASEMGTNIGT
jgi:hypothetical protein